MRDDRTKIVKAHRGLFAYSGFGMGDLYLSPTDKRWMGSCEAAQLCRDLDIKFVHIDTGDPFAYHRILIRGWDGPENEPEWWGKYNR